MGPFLGIKYPNRNTCSPYKHTFTGSKGDTFVRAMDSTLEYLSIRVKLADTTHLICTYTLVMRANRTQSVLQRAILLAGIRSRLFMHYRSSSGPARLLLLTRQTLWAGRPLNCDRSVHRFTCSWKCPRFCLLDGNIFRTLWSLFHWIAQCLVHLIHTQDIVRNITFNPSTTPVFDL